MSELVSSNDTVDLVYDVAQDQLGKKEPFLDHLSHALKVQGEFQVI